MLICDSVTQPCEKSNRVLIGEVLQGNAIDNIDVAAAYVTTGGARDLIRTMQDCLGERWEIVPKRWLISFDYCRTEPLAVQMLAGMPQSTVKVHDAVRVLQQRCVPTRPFHPKAFIFNGLGHQSVFAGSGNISRSGLNTGHEVGLLLGYRPPKRAEDVLTRAKILAVQAWYNALWLAAPKLTVALNAQYQAIFDSVPNLRHPIPTDDDPPVVDTSHGALTTEDLRKLRVCSHLWIEAGNVTKNLGPIQPGNQLMMKRLSRVFFGAPPTNVEKNSPLRHVQISFQGGDRIDRSITFSDNGMDKLTLPIPGKGGPQKYDGKSLLFTRVGPGVFDLRLGTAQDKRSWIRRSKAIEAHHVMTVQDRQWGVF